MLSGGPVYEYLPDLRALENSALFFTGFQVPGTPGRELLDTKKVEIGGIRVDFSNLNIKYFDFSAHCDSNGIKRMIKACNPQLVLVNHGEPDQCQAVVDWTEKEIGCFAFAPTLRERFEVEDYL